MPYWKEADLQLECYPKVAEHVARPWDSADEYLLRETNTSLPTLIINDRHGALSCLYPQQQNWIDSACSINAIQQNREKNRRPTLASELIKNEQQINSTLQQVVIKLPKNFEQLKFWLFHCGQQLPANTRYWLAGMTKHIPIAWLNWLERHSDHYQQFRIIKKARLIAFNAPRIDSPKSMGYQLDDIKLMALPGVFSRSKLDIGSQVLLPFLNDLLSDITNQTVCDLGCGNGLLALTIKKNHPHAHVIATDDSYTAVRASEYNAKHNKLKLETYHGNALSQINEPLDWVICNPPYHDGHKELTHIAMTMFKQSAQKLKDNGKLLLVANRHLPYRKTLNKYFLDVKLLSANPKFNVFLCSLPMAKH